ncbi:Alpha/Beta hydrolase protein [Xylaria flabelliformis]|nr:Alpha/Beta hydrolase protein [Xylaria flabelliformis]
MIGVALTLLLTLACAQPWENWALAPHCSDVHFQFTTTAANRVADNAPKDLFSDPEAIDAFLGQPVAYRNVSGTFAIYGQLCRPMHHSRIPKLQLLVHGSTYNHTYWSSLQEPSGSTWASSPPDHEELSWIHTATRLGYWTLAIDRLGQGLSSRPDPVTVVQSPLQMQLIHLIAREIRDRDLLGIQSARGGRNDGVDKLKLIYVGHSFGSGLGVNLAAAHPEDFDALILTGIATVRGNPQPGSFLARWAPAAQSAPRFPRDTPAGYLVSTNKTGREALYWGSRSDFDAEMFERDWAGQGTHPLGEVLTTAEYLVDLPEAFNKPVLVADGIEDAIFCSDFGSRALGPVRCRAGEHGEIGKTRDWFPGVSDELFATYLQPDAGHDHILHKTGDQLIDYAHNWLASIGL